MNVIALTIVLLCLSNFVVGQRVRPNEYDVYRAALAEISEADREKYSIETAFVFLDHTSIDRYMSSAFETDYKYLTRLFVRINKTPLRLEPLFQPQTFQLISESEFHELMAEGDRLEKRASNAYRSGFSDLQWRPFFQRYPHSGGIYKLSRVVFSNSGSLAMLQIQREGGGCESSEIQIRRRLRGKWVIHLGSGGGGCA